MHRVKSIESLQRPNRGTNKLTNKHLSKQIKKLKNQKTIFKNKKQLEVLQTRPVRVPSITKPLIFGNIGVGVVVGGGGIWIAEALRISYGPANN